MQSPILPSTRCPVTTKHFAREDRLFACWLLVGAGYSLAAIRYVRRVITLVTAAAFNPTLLNVMLILQRRHCRRAVPLCARVARDGTLHAGIARRATAVDPRRHRDRGARRWLSDICYAVRPSLTLTLPVGRGIEEASA